VSSIRSGSAKWPKHPLRALLAGVAQHGFSTHTDDLYGRSLNDNTVALLRLLPGFDGTDNSTGGFLVLPAVGLYYHNLDRLSHELRGTPYPRNLPYEQIGCSLPLLTQAIPRGGVRFSQRGTNEVGADQILTALENVALPELAGIAPLAGLIDLLRQSSIAPWSALPRDLLPLAYVATGQHEEAAAVAKRYLAELSARESPNSPLLRSYAAFASAIAKQSDQSDIVPIWNSRR
jgi:hypothetical protein